MTRTIGFAAIILGAWALATAAAAQNNVNGERTDQKKGESSYIQTKPTGLGQNGISRQDDIRRTASGKLSFTPAQVQAIREAAGKARLKREDHVAFTIAVGAVVPRQGGARNLPASLAKAVPTSTKLRYVLAGNQLILIDRPTSRIVAVIPGVG